MAKRSNRKPKKAKRQAFQRSKQKSMPGNSKPRKKKSKSKKKLKGRKFMRKLRSV